MKALQRLMRQQIGLLGMLGTCHLAGHGLAQALAQVYPADTSGNRSGLYQRCWLSSKS